MNDSDEIKKYLNLLEDQMLTSPKHSLTVSGINYEFIRMLIKLYADHPDSTEDFNKNYLFFRDKNEKEYFKKLFKRLGADIEEEEVEGDAIDDGNLVSPYPGNGRKKKR